MKTHDSILDPDQLQDAVAAAKDRFAQLRKKYPALKGYVVLALPGKQIGIGSTTMDILTGMPAAVVNNPAKNRMLEHLKTPPASDAGEATKKQWSNRFDQLVGGLQYDGGVHAELRFNTLDYDLIWQLQSDELVDRDLTPQTRASIRIVLGKLADMGEV